MGLDERLGYMLLGMVVGAFLGYASRMLQEIKTEVVDVASDVQDIKEEVDEIDSLVKSERPRDKGEGGFMRFPLVADIILISVLALTFWAAWSTGVTNNKLEKAIGDIESNQVADDAQDKRIRKVTSCSLEFTSKTIQALNERTTYTSRAARANADVLEAQQEFLGILATIPPPTDEEALAALRVYTTALQKFTYLTDKGEEKTDRFAYPTNQELAVCLGVKLPEVQEDK